MRERSESDIADVMAEGSEAPDSARPAPWRTVACAVGGLAALFWIAAHLRFFWLANRQLYAIDLDGNAGPAGPFGVFSALALPWTFSLGNSPPPQLAQALVALGLVQVLGIQLVRIAQIYMPFLERQALAFTLGFGVSGIAFELLTMAHLLAPIPAWILWVVLIGGAWTWRRRRGQRPVARWWNPRPDTEPVGPSGDADNWPERTARKFFECDESEMEPRPLGMLRWVAVALVGIITLLTFWHAVFLPETYWDSLILYLGYARMTFLEHGFPFKAEAQVGIGLGANYPHLFSNFGAMASTLFNNWSDLHQRIAAPLAGLAATILLYGAVRIATRSRVVAIAAALLFRLTPNAIAFTTYASDYAFTFLFVAALLHASAYFARARTPGALAVLLAIPAIAMHLNYLMLTLWGPAILAAMVGLRGSSLAPAKVAEFSGLDLSGDEPPASETPPEGPPESPDPPSPFGLSVCGKAWAMVLVLLAAGSTWYVRNAVLTGNPVYAFYPNIFTKSVRVNPEVLRSAELEWYRNGDGIARLAERHVDARTHKQRDESSPEFARAATVRDRIAVSWLYWTGFDRLHAHTKFELWKARAAMIARLGSLWLNPAPDSDVRDAQVPDWTDYRQFYKMNPLVAGFLPPGLFVALFLIACGWRAAPSTNRETRAMLVAALVVLVGFLAYMYLIADFYLYQIVAILIPCAAVGSLTLHALRRAGTIPALMLCVGFMALLFFAGVVPGIAMSAMNFKFTGAQRMDGQEYSQTMLDALRNPGMSPGKFYRLQYGDDPDMWDYINISLEGEKLLTHENRHYVFSPGITLIHLDDWEMQKGWNLASSQETVEFLLGHGIRYYLRVPNEARHAINRRMGMDQVIKSGFAREVVRFGENALYELKSFPLPDPRGDGP